MVTPESDDTNVTIEEVQGLKVRQNPEKAHGLSHFGHLDQLSTRKGLCGNGHANIVHEYSAPYIYQELVISLFATHRKYCCTPRTPGCKKYEKETLKQPPSSNFITHSMICKAIPAAESWAAFQAAHNGTGCPEMSGTGDSAAKVVGIEGQQTFIDHFTACGLQNESQKDCHQQGVLRMTGQRYY